MLARRSQRACVLEYGASVEDIALVNTTKESPPDRTEMLRGNPDVVGSSLCPFWWMSTRQASAQRSGSKRSSKADNNDKEKDMDFPTRLRLRTSPHHPFRSRLRLLPAYRATRSSPRFLWTPRTCHSASARYPFPISYG